MKTFIGFGMGRSPLLPEGFMAEADAYRKTATTRALQIDQPFCVATSEGYLEAKAGDYLCLDVKGNAYPCDREVFEQSYEPDDALVEINDVSLQRLRLQPGDYVVVRVPVGTNPNDYLDKVADVFDHTIRVLVLTNEVEIEQLSEAKLATLGLQRRIDL